MTKELTQAALDRAGDLLRLEMAAAALPDRELDFRAGWIALLAALISMIPSISAAQNLF